MEYGRPSFFLEYEWNKSDKGENKGLFIPAYRKIVQTWNYIGAGDGGGVGVEDYAFLFNPNLNAIAKLRELGFDDPLFQMILLGASRSHLEDIANSLKLPFDKKKIKESFNDIPLTFAKKRK